MNNLQLYGIKYSYLILIIFKQIYQAHIWESNKYFFKGLARALE